MDSPAAIYSRLTSLDNCVLSALAIRAVMLTRQISAICAHLGESATSRTFRRVMKKLKDYGLTLFEERIIGGKGSGFKVPARYWRLTKLGLQVAALSNKDLNSRIRKHNEDSQMNPLHAIENTDVELVIRDLDKADVNFKLTKLEYESEAVRRFNNGIGDKQLKPDLFVDTNKGSWFIETDRSTEPSICLLRKCLVYEEYINNTEPDEWRASSMPLVIWVVLPKRRIQLEAYLDKKLGPTTRKLFRIATKAELPQLLLKGGRNE